MRLIDADELVEVIRKQKVDNDAYCKMCIETMAEIVDEQPTAYNVDKVLIELDEQTNLHNISEASDYWTWITAMEKAIDIVKRGGVE